MITLQSNQYEQIKSLLTDIPGASWHLESMANRGIGTVVVDAFPNTNSVYVETQVNFAEIKHNTTM